MKNANTQERIYRIWSERQEEQIAVRIQFSVEENSGCKVFSIRNREEWS